MYKCSKYTASSGIVLLASLLLASCSSDSSDEGSGDPADLNTPEGDSTASLIVPPDVLPAVDNEGAESGLQGCLNRPLYFNGPHFVSTTHDTTHTGNTSTSSTFRQADRIYTVVDVDTEGVSQVDIETTITTPERTTPASTTPYTLDGYTVAPQGASDNNPQVMRYDLEPGESVTQILDAESEGSAGLIRTYTYVGREAVTINGQQFEACRIDSEIINDAELPQFRLVSALTDWYGVGTGLKLRTEGVGFPDSEQDRITTITVLSFGSINSVSVL